MHVSVGAWEHLQEPVFEKTLPLLHAWQRRWISDETFKAWKETGPSRHGAGSPARPDSCAPAAHLGRGSEVESEKQPLRVSSS